VKLFLTLISLSVITQFTFANRVDKLKTDSDVARFIVSLDTNLIQKRYSQSFRLTTTEQILKNRNCTGLPIGWGLKNWQKVDFNGDGLTDLLVIGLWENYTTFVAIDQGNNKFKLIRLIYSTFEQCEVSKTIPSVYGPLLLFHTNKPSPVKSLYYNKLPETDTLIYKFGAFVELNKQSANYKIDTIIFQSGTCLGTCPHFKIKIDKSGFGVYEAGSYSERQGLFKATISAGKLNELKQLLNYVNVKSLKNNYSVNWTDSPGSTLYIRFSDGSTKLIADYGEEGTFGLRQVYQLFFALANNQNWVKQ
jgi:hypothetical protein